MLAGITYFEKYVAPSEGEKHLEVLAESGFKHIEFSPHPTLIDFSVLKTLVRKANCLGMSTAFHNPDFVDPYHYSLNYFRSNYQMKEKIMNLLCYLCEINLNKQPITFVLHGASSKLSENPEKELLNELNHRAFDYLSNEIIRRQLPVQLLLENTCYIDEYGVTQKVEDLMSFLKKHQGAPIDLCLDIAHWYRQYRGLGEAPEICFDAAYQFLFDKIKYAHLHGVSENLEKSHLSLEIENSFYFDFVKAFYENKKEIIFNLEIFDLQGIEKFSTYESVVKSNLQLLVEYCR